MSKSIPTTPLSGFEKVQVCAHLRAEGFDEVLAEKFASLLEVQAFLAEWRAHLGVLTPQAMLVFQEWVTEALLEEERLFQPEGVSVGEKYWGDFLTDVLAVARLACLRADVQFERTCSDEPVHKDVFEAAVDEGLQKKHDDEVQSFLYSESCKLSLYEARASWVKPKREFYRVSDRLAELARIRTCERLCECRENVSIMEQQRKRVYSSAPLYKALAALGESHAMTMHRRRLARRLRRLSPKATVSSESKPPVFQAGDQVKLDKRAEREAEQRKHAAAKAEAERKSVPKMERLRNIKQHRDKRNPAVYQSGLHPGVCGSASLTGPFSHTKAVSPASGFRSGVRRVFQSGISVLGGLGIAGAGLLVKGLVGLFKKAEGAAEIGGSLMATIKKKIEGAGSEFKRALGSALWTVPLIMTMFFVFHRILKQGPVLPVLLCSVLAKVVGPKVWDLCSDFFQDRTVVLQSGFDAFASGAPKLFATLFCFSALKGRRPFAITEFVKRISTLDRAALGWETFLGWFTKAFETAINYFRSLFGKGKISLMRSQNVALHRWKAEVDEILELSCTGGDIDTKRLTHMVSVIRRGFDFKAIYAGTPMARSVEDYLVKASAALQPYEGALKARNNFRLEPSMAMFYGEPGVGKTLMAVPFCISVLKLSGIITAEATFEETISQIWQKGVSEYWNGYAGQECLVLDDCFQARPDKTNTENDYMNIIRAVSTWSFPLNFADLASKGKIYFSSKMIYGTTNLPSIYQPACEVIFDPLAVSRRISHPYHIRVTKPYQLANGMLNFEAFQSCLKEASVTATGVDRFPWHIWEVSRHDYLSGLSSSTYVPLKEVIVSMADDLRKKFVGHGQQEDILKDFVSKLFDEPVIELQSGARSYSDVVADVFPSLSETSKILDEVEVQASVVRKTLSFFLKAIACALLIRLVSEGMRFLFNVISVLLCAPGRLLGREKKKEKQMQSNTPSRGPVRTGLKMSSPRLQGYDDAIATNAYANTYKLIATLDGGHAVVVGQILFIKDRLALQPAHFTREIVKLVSEGSLAKGNNITLRNANNPEFEVALTALEYLAMRRHTLASKEVEFLEVPMVRAHRNISANFINEKDAKNIGGHPVRLYVCNVEQRGALGKGAMRKVHVSTDLLRGNKLTVAGHTIERYLRYNASTESGDCGAVLSALDPSRFSGRVCMGVHFAGSTDKMHGYAAIVTQEMLSAAADMFATIKDEFASDLADRGVEFHSSNVLPFAEPGSFLPLYTVNKPVHLSPKTGYFVTSEYGVLGEYNDKPAPLGPVLRDGQMVFPMANAVKPYASPVKYYSQPYLEQAVHIALQPLMGMIANRSKEVYTFEEAILGIPSEKFRSIPRATSAGYPYVLEVRNGKKEFFGEDDEYSLEGERAIELRKRVDHILESARNNTRLSVVFVDFLKDELRSPAKVESVSTRLISAAPLDYVVAWRMMFGAFSAAFMSCCVKSGMAPGVNVYSDVGDMANFLSSKGSLVFDGDFKAFDSSEQPCLHDKVLEKINEWYADGPDNARIRRVLWCDMTHSRHIGGLGFDQRHIYQWNKSLPSGHPFTTIINSIYSLVLLVSAYISITGDWSGFWREVAALTYGDDNVVNTSDRLGGIYNQSSVSECLFREFGVVYTPGDKTGEFKTDMTIKDVTFLKRAFRLEDGRWLCPLDLNSFLFTAYWCKNSRLVKDIVISMWENALEELSMHPQRVWDQYASTIVERLFVLKKGTRYPPNRKSYLEAVLRRTDDWY